MKWAGKVSIPIVPVKKCGELCHLSYRPPRGHTATSPVQAASADTRPHARQTTEPCCPRGTPSRRRKRFALARANRPRGAMPVTVTARTSARWGRSPAAVGPSSPTTIRAGARKTPRGTADSAQRLGQPRSEGATRSRTPFRGRDRRAVATPDARRATSRTTALPLRSSVFARRASRYLRQAGTLSPRRLWRSARPRGSRPNGNHRDAHSRARRKPSA